MQSFSKGGIKIIDKGAVIYAYANHPNMGRVPLFRLDHQGFSTGLRSGEEWIKNMLRSAGIHTDPRLEGSYLFNNWFYKN